MSPSPEFALVRLPRTPLPEESSFATLFLKQAARTPACAAAPCPYQSVPSSHFSRSSFCQTVCFPLHIGYLSPTQIRVPGGDSSFCWFLITLQTPIKKKNKTFFVSLAHIVMLIKHIGDLACQQQVELYVLIGTVGSKTTIWGSFLEEGVSDWR